MAHIQPKGSTQRVDHSLLGLMKPMDSAGEKTQFKNFLVKKF